MRMTSGACRRVFFRALCQESVSTPTSRWVMTQPLCWMHVFDRILDGDDVAAGLLVAVAHHGGKRRGFSGARAADDDDESALGEHHVLQHRRQVEFLEGRDLGVDEADDAAGCALLHEGADAKAADALRRDREVALLGGIKFLGLAIVHDGAHQGRGLLDRERALALRPDLTVDLDGRRKARRDEQVRGLLFNDATQQVLHQLDRLIAIHRSTSNPCSEPCSAPLPCSQDPWTPVPPDTDPVSACPAPARSGWRSTSGQPCPRG